VVKHAPRSPQDRRRILRLANVIADILCRSSFGLTRLKREDPFSFHVLRIREKWEHGITVREEVKIVPIFKAQSVGHTYSMRNRIRRWRIRCTFLLTAITLSLLARNVLVTSFVPGSSFLSSTYHDSPAGTARSLLQSTPNHYTGSEGNRNSRSSVSKCLPSKSNTNNIRP
jgi:hypothetical protein